MQKEVALRLHKSNEQIILQLQEIGLENQEFNEYFKLNDQMVLKVREGSGVDDDAQEQVLGS